MLKILSNHHFFIGLENCVRYLIVCQVKNAYVIKFYICLNKIQNYWTNVYCCRVQKLFFRSETNVCFCKYLKNGRRKKETINYKNVKLNMFIRRGKSQRSKLIPIKHFLTLKTASSKEFLHLVTSKIP